MACKKSELVSVINSFTNARITGDANLVNFSTNLLNNFLDSIEFAPEEPAEDAPVEEVPAE